MSKQAAQPNAASVGCRSCRLLSAAKIARDLAEGRTSPNRILDIVDLAMEVREPMVQAFATTDLVRARDACSMAQGPLFGIPFAAKDNFDTHDFETAYGSSIYEGHRPSEDAASVALARQAGAILVGKATMAEFALMQAPETRNPRDLDRTPGGSSSGSAAAVAAGIVAFALGTQTAGSVIRPAAFCGIAGFKPTFGRLPVAGVKAVAPSLDTVGLFAASVADAAFVMEGLRGRETAQISAINRLRMGLCLRWSNVRGTPEMKAAVRRAAEAAAHAGATVKEILLPPTIEKAHAAHATIMSYEAVRALSHERDVHGTALSQELSDFLASGASITAEDHEHAQEIAAQAKRATDTLFGEVDVLLTPSAAGPAPNGIAQTGSSEFNRLWTLLHLPVVNVPGLTDHSGLPLGVQLIGPHGADDLVLASGAFLEDALACSA